jgi:transposase
VSRSDIYQIRTVNSIHVMQSTVSPTMRAPYRRHTAEFKSQLCRDIRSGTLGRREAQKKYALSDNLIQLWLAQHDRLSVASKTGDSTQAAIYEERIAALERKVGQLTMELEQRSTESG